MPDFLTPGRRNLRGLAKACVKICDGPCEGDEFDSLCQDAFANLTMVYMLLAKSHHRAVAEREELAALAAKKSTTKAIAIENLSAYELRAQVRAYKKSHPEEFAAALQHYKEEEESVPVNGENMEDCSECGGTGVQFQQSCPNCDGSGKICALCNNPKTSCTCESEEDDR